MRAIITEIIIVMQNLKKMAHETLRQCSSIRFELRQWVSLLRLWKKKMTFLNVFFADNL